MWLSVYPFIQPSLCLPLYLYLCFYLYHLHPDIHLHLLLHLRRSPYTSRYWYVSFSTYLQNPTRTDLLSIHLSVSFLFSFWFLSLSLSICMHACSYRVCMCETLCSTVACHIRTAQGPLDRLHLSGQISLSCLRAGIRGVGFGSNAEASPAACMNDWVHAGALAASELHRDPPQRD